MMKKLLLGSILALLCSTIPLLASAADRVGDFSLLDENGYFHAMNRYDDGPAIAFLVQANGSEAVQQALPKFAGLRAEYEEQGIKFFLINPMGLTDRNLVRAEMQKFGIEIPVLMDDSQVIADAMGIDKTGEVFLFNSKRFTVEFRGPVGIEFEQAMRAVLDGQPVSSPFVAMSGDPVNYLFSSEQVSYEKDIASIITENCARCHRDGGIAPFAMDSHTMLQGWSPMIREVLMTKRMPPAQVDPHIGDFVNDMNIADSDVQKLVRWIEAGSPNDSIDDPLAKLT